MSNRSSREKFPAAPNCLARPVWTLTRFRRSAKSYPGFHSCQASWAAVKRYRRFFFTRVSVHASLPFVNDRQPPDLFDLAKLFDFHRPRYYRLEGRTVVPCDDVLEWASWFETAERVVRQTRIDEHLVVSTVFLGLDHNYTRTGPPLLFETMVFRHGSGDETRRYSTWEEADEGHEEVVEEILRGED